MGFDTRSESTSSHHQECGSAGPLSNIPRGSARSGGATTLRMNAGHFVTFDEGLIHMQTTTSSAGSSKPADFSQRGYSRDLRVPEMVGRQAIQNPHRTALVGDGLELTYRELDAQANQLAH